MMNVLLYGGSFNPPHIGHIAAARTAWNALTLDKLIWVPSGDPPHKTLPPGTPATAHRLKMCSLAIKSFPGAEVDDIEMRLKLRYTFDTAESLAASMPDAGITILVGSDMLMSILSWHRAPELLARYKIAALARVKDSFLVLEEKAKELERFFGASVAVLPHSPVEISSTVLREMLRRREGRQYLSDPVYEYIMSYGLYQ